MIGGRALALDMIVSNRPSHDCPRIDDARADKDERFTERTQIIRERRREFAWVERSESFADNKRWLNRGLKAALSEARAEHARHQVQTRSAKLADLDVSTKGRVMVAVLNRPDKKNAFSSEMLDDLRSALQTANDDSAIGCMVITGAGDAFLLGWRLGQAIKKKGAGNRLHPSNVKTVCRKSPTKLHWQLKLLRSH